MQDSGNYNNIYKNVATYTISIGSNFQGSVLNSESNWWGTAIESEIQDKIYDFFDDASKGFVDYTPYLYAPIGPGDNLWNLRSNADDRFHDNTPWLRPWRYSYEDGWGRWVGEWSYEVQWGGTYTQWTGSAGGIDWNTDANGNLPLTGGQDHQWHVWTHVYMISPKSITIPATCDCVPRAFLNYDFDNPIGFPATLNFQAGWNHIDITGYNQNNGYAFDLNYPLAENVDAMGSNKLYNDAPISPPTGLVATPGPGTITVSWSPNPEPDRAGYRVYWDTDPDYPYANVVDVGNVTSYVLDGLPNATYYVTVTAYDTAYNPANDDPATIVNENQTNGNESWFAVEKTVTEPHTLTVYKVGTGGGTVTTSPAGIDCGTDCDAVYNTCEEVTLTATQDVGSTFAGWGGDCSGTPPDPGEPEGYKSTTVYMCTDKTCIATFLIDTDNDGDGYTGNQGDCDDNNAAINPGAVEVCDGVDNNCDGQIDEGVLNTYYRDADGDTYGNASVTTQACTQPQGYVANNTDCNDDNSAINPGAKEICDGVDNDCNAGTADGSGESWYGNPISCGVGVCSNTGISTCSDGNQVNTCTPKSPMEAPEATCNDLLDNDCDGLTDTVDPNCGQITVNPEEIDFGCVNLDSYKTVPVTISNNGEAALGIEEITLEGTNADQFKIENNNCLQTLNQNASCAIDVAFWPDSQVEGEEPIGKGIKRANLSIKSYDFESPVKATLRGTGVDGSKDLDGDCIPDNEDDYLGDNTKATPLSAEKTGKITINSPAKLSNVQAYKDDDPILNPANKPTGYEFKDGLVSFRVEEIPLPTDPTATCGNTIDVQITFPTSITAGAKYYKVSDDGWSEFPNAKFSGNRVTLTLTDGCSGDRDGLINGVIDDPGGVATKTPTETVDTGGVGGDGGGEGGGGGVCFIATAAYGSHLARLSLFAFHSGNIFYIGVHNYLKIEGRIL